MRQRKYFLRLRILVQQKIYLQVSKEKYKFDLFQDTTNYIHVPDPINDAVDDPMNVPSKKKVTQIDLIDSIIRKNRLGYICGYQFT